MKRIALFLATNFAILLVLMVILAVLDQSGVLPPEALGGHARTLVIAAVFGFGGSIISLLMSKTIARWSTRAKIIERPSNELEGWLLQTVGSLAQRADLRMPQVAIYDAPDVNAFATGPSRNRGLVAVSTGLLRSMPRHEAEAVLAHEVAHIQNGDMVTLTLIQGVLNTFVIFASRVIGSIVDGAMSREGGSQRGRGMGYWMVVMVLQVVFGMVATVIVMAFSRHREFRADAGSAKLVGAQNMVAALRRLGAQRGPAALPSSVAAFGIRGGGMSRLFSSHPPIAERIRALESGSHA